MTVYINGVAQVVAHEATHVSGGADDIDSALVIAAMANLATGKIWRGNANRPAEVDVPTAGYGRLTVTGFQLYTAFGTMENPESLNNGSTTEGPYFDAIAEYAEITLAAALRITQFRQFGHADNDGDGAAKVQYQDIDGNWNDWVTGIADRTSADWSGWDSSGGAVVAIAIRFVCTATPTDGLYRVTELEVKY